MKREVSAFMVTLILFGTLVVTSERAHAVGITKITNILVNPDFDSGPGLPWVEYSKAGYPIISSPSDGLPSYVRPLPSEPYAAWFGGYSDAYDFLYQDITIPDYATKVVLEGYRYMTTEEFGAYDIVTIDVNGTLILRWTSNDPPHRIMDNFYSVPKPIHRRNNTAPYTCHNRLHPRY